MANDRNYEKGNRANADEEQVDSTDPSPCRTLGAPFTRHMLAPSCTRFQRPISTIWTPGPEFWNEAKVLKRYVAPFNDTGAVILAY